MLKLQLISLCGRLHQFLFRNWIKITRPLHSPGPGGMYAAHTKSVSRDYTVHQQEFKGCCMPMIEMLMIFYDDQSAATAIWTANCTDYNQ
jgi:hypothetical protein